MLLAMVNFRPSSSRSRGYVEKKGGVSNLEVVSSRLSQKVWCTSEHREIEVAQGGVGDPITTSGAYF